MVDSTAIIGFRQDRIGARLICLLNTLRLARKFGVSGRYLWLSQPDGPYPELVDPRHFLTAEFVAAHIEIVFEAPSRAGLQNVRAVAPGMNVQGFARALAEGRRYECDSMSEVVRFIDEDAATVAAEMRAVAADLALTPRLGRALAKARRVIARAGGGAPVAIHVRRGDILDGDPWSYSSWASKYVPDEFFRAFIAGHDGPVIAFSDTPAAVAHLRQGDDRVLLAADLLDTAALSPAERDLLELLLMAGCAEVGAPSHSAFSRAAAVIGGCRIRALPPDLPDAARRAGFDAVLERVIARPDSFFAPGDLAQSAAYAARHAASVGRGGELVDALADRRDLLARFPFLYRELAATAWSAGRKQKARRLARQGLESPLIRNRDKPLCRQVLLVSETTDPDQLGAAFVNMVFTGHAAEGPIMPALGLRLLSAGGKTARMLGFAPALLPLYAQPDPQGGPGQVLPLWAVRIDWFEFIRDPGLQSEALNWPDMWRKMRPAAAGLAEAEAALAAGTPPAAPDAAVAARFGFCASVLRLHGRLRRAMALLEWLDAARPGDFLTAKRLANACFAAGNRKAGWRWLDLAQARAPGHALLLLSQAVRAAEQDEPDRAARALALAEAAWPGLQLERSVRRAAREHLPAKT
ncbi:hypothetical protein [Paracoccus sp. N5]|uniref:hypothetical protein n=1 Tax=Paracoccus sp. N5 TaxID=1101189 RepID=UPI000367496D|nr:hypothetical protein [Paracoccus sp. N5]